MKTEICAKMTLTLDSDGLVAEEYHLTHYPITICGHFSTESGQAQSNQIKVNQGKSNLIRLNPT
jgi:hypothetical protein